MRMKRGHPSLDSVKGCKSCDQGSVLLFPIMMALTPYSSISLPTSRLKSAEYSYTWMPYLKKQTSVNFCSLCRFIAVESSQSFGISPRWSSLANTCSLPTYSCSICARNSVIYSNSLSLTKWTNLMRRIKSNGSAYDSWATTPSLRLRAALSRCSATVQSFPPLKLKAIYSGLNKEAKSVRNEDFFEMSCSWAAGSGIRTRKLSMLPAKSRLKTQSAAWILD